MSIYKELDYTSNVENVIGMQFGIFSPEEIENQSVAEITKQETYMNNEPVIGGLFDPRMGVLDHGKRCKSCEQYNYFCPGHFGHIRLARPVFYVHFMPMIIKVLKCVCISCSALLCKNNIEEIEKKNNKTRWLDVCVQCSTVKRCGEKNSEGCGAKQPNKYIKDGISKIYAEWKDDSSDNENKRLLLTAEHIKKIFSRITDEDCEIMGFTKNWCRPDWMICTNLLVPPPQVRPTVQQDNTQRMDDDLTHKLVDIIKANKIIKQKIENDSAASIIDDWTQVLQYHVATFIDNEIPGIPAAQQRSGRPLKSVRQRLKAKEGRVRGNLMGKRVDYSARSVITPDPNISIDQLGVPYQIAMNLTFPEVVTKFNIKKLYMYIRNGPKKYPGANSIKRISDGKNISLSYVNLDIIKLNIGDIVHRHLLNEDVVLFNRQPSLHKMSMMAHRVKVMSHSTFRLNVSVTGPYNADFDGDEMNMHAPQSIQARYEIKCLAGVSSQIISPRENKPVISIVQDSLLGVNRLTAEGVYFNEKEMMNLLMWNNNFNGKLPAPKKIERELSFWSSHQLLSLILPNITLNMPNKMFNEDKENPEISNNFINIINGELIKGQFDKDIMSKSSRGIIQVLFNDYGAEVTKLFLDNIQNIITNYLLKTGFSCGVSDLIADEDTIREIKTAINKERDEVAILTQHVHLNIFENSSSKNTQEVFEDKINDVLNRARRIAGSIGVKSLKNNNRIVNMVKAGSKGNELNVAQMISCVGQQNIDGKRIPYGFVDRTLPHYTKFNDGSESRGFVESSFIEGLKPQEFFFHAMGGREGLIDTAVKTSETGYIQRKLVKAMEDLSVKYDGTVRNAAEGIIQFIYGDDGMDSTKVENQFVNTVKMNQEQIYNKFVFHENENYQLFLDKKTFDELDSDLINTRMLDYYNSLIEDRNFIISKIHDNSINSIIYYPINLQRLVNTTCNLFELNKNSFSDVSPLEILDTIDSLEKELVVNSIINKNIILGILLRYYLSPKILIKEKKITKSAFDYIIGIIKQKFYDSIVQPGEMVGAIAAQSIGEPATQMTLNTFHFAGVGEKSNVTRGVPRLKELLSISKNLKNPSVTVYLKDEYSSDKNKAKEVINNLEYTPLKCLIESTKIFYDPDDSNTNISEDVELMELYKDFNEINNEIRSDSSPWVLRFEFNRKLMLDKEISMYDIYSNIKKVYDNNITCIYSDDNSSKLIFRIRIKDISMDKIDDSILLKTLESNILEKIILRGVKNIDKVFISKKKGYAVFENEEYINKEPWVLYTDGINMLDVMNLSEVDYTKCFSNDIHEIYNIFGIEAARNALITEMTEVIVAEGAYVNSRHIELLCDIMTNRGNLMSIDRHGINRGDIGPLAKSSFEETTDQLIKASLFSEYDKINGVSANIMMGQLAPCGTGLCDIILDQDAVNEWDVVDEEPQIDNEEEIDDEYIEQFLYDTDEDCVEENIEIDYTIPENENVYISQCDNIPKIDGVDIE